MPPKGERRKQQIIDTAKEMFIQNGFQSTHIGQVCEKLSIARGTVYQYFSNKKEILYAILDKVLENIEDIFDQDDFNDFFNAGPEASAILEFVINRISSCMNVLVNEPIVIKLIFKDIVGVDGEVNERVRNSIISIEKIINREIEDLMQRGIFNSEIDSKITASMVVGGITLIVYEYEKMNLDVLDENIVQSIAKNFLNGVMK